MKAEPESKTQEFMLRKLVRHGGNLQVAAHGRAPFLSACRALMRRGLAGSYITGDYYATEAGKQWVRDHPGERP